MNSFLSLRENVHFYPNFKQLCTQRALCCTEEWMGTSTVAKYVNTPWFLPFYHFRFDLSRAGDTYVWMHRDASLHRYKWACASMKRWFVFIFRSSYRVIQILWPVCRVPPNPVKMRSLGNCISVPSFRRRSVELTRVSVFVVTAKCEFFPKGWLCNLQAG